MKDYKYYLEQFGEYGEVIAIKDSIIKVEGLPNCRLNEMVVFENGGQGQIVDIKRDFCRIALLQKNLPKTGEKVSRTDSLLTVPVSIEMLGTMINPLGEIISPENKKIKDVEYRSIENEIGGIERRSKIIKQFSTGLTVVDALLPLGNGQKELIIGDRKTGKTSFLLTVTKNQIKLGKNVIFVAIGKKKTDINNILNYFISEKILDKIIFVVSSSDDSENLIYLAPYTAMTIAEYFLARDLDTLVILDDLSTHAKIYRQIGLNSDKFPGKESYPGDIFYLHARLLERAGNFRSKSGKDISITCLPVAESVEGDMAGYITTNLMGITDGHIYFDRSIFIKGRRPAINMSLSVTRVGRQTQSELFQQVNHEITAFLTEYESLQNLAHFGAELSAKVKTTISRGERISKAFDQRSGEIVPEFIQLILLGIAYSEAFFESDIRLIKEKLLKERNSDWVKKLIDNIKNMKNFGEIVEYIEKSKMTIIGLITN